MSKLKERESYLEARRKLTGPRGQGTSAEGDKDSSGETCKWPGQGRGAKVNGDSPASGPNLQANAENSGEPEHPHLPGANASRSGEGAVRSAVSAEHWPWETAVLWASVRRATSVCYFDPEL